MQHRAQNLNQISVEVFLRWMWLYVYSGHKANFQFCNLFIEVCGTEYYDPAGFGYTDHFSVWKVHSFLVWAFFLDLLRITKTLEYHQPSSFSWSDATLNTSTNWQEARNTFSNIRGLILQIRPVKPHSVKVNIRIHSSTLLLHTYKRKSLSSFIHETRDCLILTCRTCSRRLIYPAVHSEPYCRALLLSSSHTSGWQAAC